MSSSQTPPRLQLESFFPYRLSILEQRVSESVASHYAARFNLARYEWRVMATLALYQPMTGAAVSGFTRLEKMQVSRAIQGLKQAGLVDQSPNPDDKRATLLRLTPEGEAVYAQIAPQVLEQETRILAGLTPSEQRTLRELTDKLDAWLARLEADEAEQ